MFKGQVFYPNLFKIKPKEIATHTGLFPLAQFFSTGIVPSPAPRNYFIIILISHDIFSENIAYLNNRL